VLNAPFTSFSRLGTGARRCHEAAMARDKGRDARSGGSLLAIAIIAGAVAGSLLGQASVGVLAGAGAGLLMLLIVWLIDRRRSR